MPAAGAAGATAATTPTAATMAATPRHVVVTAVLADLVFVRPDSTRAVALLAPA